ncbi:hypothetical protein [Hymenobacter psychrotolerans]|uniref:Uncharacterized protein n=1 Tax=Hymenobacter psychrotolerans DSM 18569 TaxID=1121959 RepID=A0A1M6UTI6_9BACT|nr:hypothetical protein [Hymenobacter psychrotolerans]SHK72453.1 hypothetical protein SAMN02746009_01472 [Hymenobacter psychrotolerans DSM 18569]
MKNKLRKLLTHYQQERDTLQALIDSCTEEGEYKLAGSYAKGLLQLDQKLRTLHNLADPLYDEKQHRRAVVERARAMLLEEGEDRMLAEILREQESRLAALEHSPTEKSPAAVQNHLRQTISKLLTKKIESFSLSFGPELPAWCSWSGKRLS